MTPKSQSELCTEIDVPQLCKPPCAAASRSLKQFRQQLDKTSVGLLDTEKSLRPAVARPRFVAGLAAMNQLAQDAGRSRLGPAVTVPTTFFLRQVESEFASITFNHYLLAPFDRFWSFHLIGDFPAVFGRWHSQHRRRGGASDLERNRM